MKNKPFIQLGVCMVTMLLMVASCEKMNIADSGDGTDGHANVTVRVSRFEQVPFDAYTRAEASETSTRLNFAVYDSGGTRLQQVNQKEGDGDFGLARFTLPEGHYFLVVLAHSSNGNPTMTNPQKINFSNAKGYTDTFLYGDSLIIGDTGVEKSLTLKRIVAKVRFIYEDTPPSSANRVQFYYTGGAGTFDGSTGWGNVKSKQAQWYDINPDNNVFEIYTIPHEGDEQYLKVQVTAFRDDTQLTQKEIDSIPITRNRITICRGNLFNSGAVNTRTNSFSVSVDDNWEKGEDINI